MPSNGTILVVDDDDSVRLLVQRILEEGGYDVITANNGIDALMTVDKTPPDCVISDIMMPDLDGLEFVQGLRGHPTTKNLPVIFLTASEDPAHLTKGINLGAKQFMTKPIDAQKLLEKVGQLIRRK